MAKHDYEQDLLTRQAPHSPEAEMSALGAMMLSQQACDDVLSRIRDDGYFYLPRHQEIYRAIRQLHLENQAVDLITVRNALQQRGKLESAGGVEYLYQLNEYVPTAANAEHYAGIVVDYAVLRSLQSAGHEIVKLVTEPELDIDEKVEKAESLVYGAGQSRLGKEFVTTRELAKDFFKEIDHLMDTNEPKLGMPSGFVDLDKLTTGLYPGDLVILAARPAMGKTSLALNFAVQVAKENLGSVAVFSLEMTGDQLIRRMISTLANVPMSFFRKPGLSDRDYQKLADACDDLYRWPIFVDDTSDVSPTELKGKCRRLMAKGRLSLIIVDYLQLMKSSSRKTENRNQEIGEIARSLKQTAKDLRVPIIALCQVNRAVESRDDKRPALSDLRESGSIEAEADIVMSIYRNDYYQKRFSDKIEQFDAKRAEVAELGILKHRNGPTGTILLAFQPAYTRFSNLDDNSKQEYEESLKKNKAEASD